MLYKNERSILFIVVCAKKKKETPFHRGPLFSQPNQQRASAATARTLARAAKKEASVFRPEWKNLTKKLSS